jgi:hypothetical protein
MFRNLKELLKVIKETITQSFDMSENVNDFGDMLVKSILLRIIEIYLENSKIMADKEKILKTLSTSLEVLAPSALIINLGLMVKPIFSDPTYLEKKSKEDQVSINVVDRSDIALKIKSSIDQWIKSQTLNIDMQDEIKDKMVKEFIDLSKKFGLESTSPHYQQILLESTEMLNMQLTAISLMMDFGDEDLSPQPIG